MMLVFISALVAVASADVHAPTNLLYPEYYCRDTNTSEREICTYVYEKEEVIAPRTTTQVTYDQKPETMKVTTCGAA